jgi:hypothetical protein
VDLSPAIEAVEQFIADAHAILEEHGGPCPPAFEAIGERMRPLVKRRDLEELKAGSPLPGGRLYSEPEGLQLMLAEFPSTTAVHTHGTWGVMVGFRGTERYRQWVREDDGSEPGKAKLRLLRDIEVAPGDVGWWYPPPNDIHQQLLTAGPTKELILMGNPPAGQRLYFNVEAGTYTQGAPAQHHYST